jgi:hypothetical protein
MTMTDRQRRGPPARKKQPASLTHAEALRVRAAVKALHLEFHSDAAVAEATGLGSVTLFRVRTGTCAAGRKVATKVAEALKVEVGALLDGSAVVTAAEHPGAETPKLAGEVWRGAETEDGDVIVTAVAPIEGALAPRFWYPSDHLPPGRWMVPAPDFGYRIMAAWALHERAVGEAERKLRKAQKRADSLSAAIAGGFARSHEEIMAALFDLEAAADALRALGRDP